MGSLYSNALNLEETGLVQALTSHRLDSQSDRRRFYDQVRLGPEQLVFCRQVHGNKVEVVLQPSRPYPYPLPLAEADAIITNQVDLAIAVFTADCIPIFILDLCTCSIGIVHAGWRGTYKLISAKAIQSMQKHFLNCSRCYQSRLGKKYYEAQEKNATEYFLTNTQYTVARFFHTV